MTEQTAVTTREPNPLVQLREQLEQRAGELKMVLPSHISPEKFQRTVLTAAQQNPQLLTVDRRSFLLACMKAAQDALLPDGREAAIIPFKENKKVDGQWQTKWVAVYMPMVYGLRKKILQSAEVVALEPGVVYAAEVEAAHFYYEVGKYPPLGHRPMLTLTAKQTTDDQIVGAYSIATMKDGTKSYEFMRRFEIDKVRECSQTGATRDRKGEQRKPSGPWVEWFPEQCKKTAMRRHSKSLPMSGDVIIDVEGREIDAGVSAAALLDSTAPDEPTLITDDNGDTIDAGTGEVVEEAEKPETTGSEDAGEDEDATGEQSGGTTGTDELGLTQDPAEAKTDETIAAFNKAENMVDLKKLYKAVEPHLAFMPAHLSKAIEDAYDRNVARLTPTKEAAPKAEAEAEPAK